MSSVHIVACSSHLFKNISNCRSMFWMAFVNLIRKAGFQMLYPWKFGIIPSSESWDLFQHSKKKFLSWKYHQEHLWVAVAAAHNFWALDQTFLQCYDWESRLSSDTQREKWGRWNIECVHLNALSGFISSSSHSPLNSGLPGEFSTVIGNFIWNWEFHLKLGISFEILMKLPALTAWANKGKHLRAMIPRVSQFLLRNSHPKRLWEP